MLSLNPKPAPQYRPPSRVGYRFRRFLFSKTWWAISRVMLPLMLIGVIGYQLFSSQALRDFVSDSKASISEWVAFMPGLKIDDLVIENATELQEDEILRALNIDMPTSTLLIDRDALRETMATFDEVGDSNFRFGFNGKLYIGLKARVPELIYFDGSQMITVDGQGHRVEGLRQRADRPELFVMSGEGALEATPEALKIIHALAPYTSKIRGLVRMGARRWDIVLINEARLLLPAERPLDALSVILKEHQSNDVLNRDIEAYDMRDPARPVLRLKPQALEEMRELQNTKAGTGQNI